MSPQTQALLEKSKLVLKQQRVLLDAAKQIQAEAAELLEQLRASQVPPRLPSLRPAPGQPPDSPA